MMNGKQESKPFEEQWMRADEYRTAYGGFTLVDVVPGTETRTVKGGRKMLAKATSQPDRLAIVSKDRWGRWSVFISREAYTPPRPRYRDEGAFLASFEGPLPGERSVYEDPGMERRATTGEARPDPEAINFRAAAFCADGIRMSTHARAQARGMDVELWSALSGYDVAIRRAYRRRRISTPRHWTAGRIFGEMMPQTLEDVRLFCYRVSPAVDRTLANWRRWMRM